MLIVLTGFMATGKSSAGKVLAEMLGYEFYDTDSLIEQQLGSNVARVFAELGEDAFRKAEHTLCANLAQKKQAVVATGGGTLVRAENLKVFEGASTLVVCLSASTQALTERLSKHGALVEDRPIMAEGLARLGNIGDAIDELMAERKSAYAKITHQIETDNKSIEDVARIVFELATERRFSTPDTAAGSLCHPGSDCHPSESWDPDRLLQEKKKPPLSKTCLTTPSAAALDASLRWHDNWDAHDKTCLTTPGAVALDASLRWHDNSATHDKTSLMTPSAVALDASLRWHDNWDARRNGSTHGNGNQQGNNSIATFLHHLGIAPCKVAIVTQPAIATFHAKAFCDALCAAGFEPHVLHIPSTEVIAKRLTTIETLASELAALRFHRHDVIVALGGGVVCDVAGLLASLYMRGLSLVQAPTTLLAMVDASIGGKNGVDMSAGKNLLGTFHAPRGIYFDPNVLKTLPQHELSHGMAEVIKHALIGDAELFDELLDATDVMALTLDPRFLQRAANVKINLVQTDPFENGVRAHLNLGHTFGHALEQATGFDCPHGAAVAIGLVAATHLAQLLNMLEDLSLPARLEQILAKCRLPTSMRALARLYPSAEKLTPSIIFNAMQNDKKQNSEGLRFIIPHRPGHVSIVHGVTATQAQHALSHCWLA
jgi:3-dehydroquinate synthase